MNELKTHTHIREEQQRWRNLPEALPKPHQQALFDEMHAEETTDARRQEIRETLCMHNLRLVQEQATKLTPTSEASAEVFSAGVCGLLKAIDKFRQDEDSGMFYSYARLWIRGEIVKATYAEEGLREKQARDVNRWRKWAVEAADPTPEKAVEEGVVRNPVNAFAARAASAGVSSTDELLGLLGEPALITTATPVTAPHPSTDEDRQHALQRILALGLAEEDLELLLDWAAEGCPRGKGAGVQQALNRAKAAAETVGIHMPFLAA